MANNKEVKVRRYKLEISNWEKTLFPEKKLRKSDLINYYTDIADYMLSYFKNCLVTLHRFPDGIGKKGFYQKKYQKHYPHFLKSYDVDLVEGGKEKQIVCNKKADIIYLAGQGTIEFHTWLSKITSIEKPTRLLFDLDPPENGGDFKQLIKVSRGIKKVLDEVDLTSYVMSTGSKGLHVSVPIKPAYNFDKVRQFTRNIADYIANEYPNEFTTALQKNKRQGRIFIDYTRNAYGQTSIVPYGLRALKEAPIATPFAWDELDSIKSAQIYTIDTIFKRLLKRGDPWKAFYSKPATLTQKKMKKIEDLVEVH